MNVLTGKRALISVASSEFALPIARALGKRGADVALIDDDIERLHRSRNELEADAIRSSVFQTGAKHTHIESTLVAVSTAMGSPDTYVLCPPDFVFQPHSFEDVEHAQDMMENCYLHHYHWAVEAGKHLCAARAGQIVFIIGLAYNGGWRGWGASASSFAAIQAMSNTLAVEWAEYGVRVNTLTVGVTEAMAKQISQQEPAIAMELVRMRTPQQRFLHPDSVANALLYLVSPSSSYVTGECLRVDGGWSAWGRLYAQAK